MSTPTGRARELGANLRFFRERSEWSEKKAAAYLEISQGQLCRIEQGIRTVSETNVARALTLYGVRGDELTETLALATEVNDRYRIRPHHDKLPDELRTLIHHETTASYIDSYQLSLIPGLLQTEGYARELLTWGGQFEADGVELRVRARMERQLLLRERRRPSFRFFIHESALTPAIISPEIMHDQWMALMFASSLPNCEPRIVPAEVPNGVFGGPFLFLRYAGYHPTVCVENCTTSAFLEDPADLLHYTAIVNKLASLALSAEESHRRFVRLAT